MVEDIAAGHIPDWIDLAPDALALEQLAGALGHGVVMAVATTAHAGHQIVAFEEVLPLVAGELGGFNWSSQHRVARRIEDRRSAFLQESSTPASCVGCCWPAWSAVRPTRTSIAQQAPCTLAGQRAWRRYASAAAKQLRGFNQCCERSLAHQPLGLAEARSCILANDRCQAEAGFGMGHGIPYGVGTSERSRPETRQRHRPPARS